MILEYMVQNFRCYIIKIQKMSCRIWRIWLRPLLPRKAVNEVRVNAEHGWRRRLVDEHTSIDFLVYSMMQAEKWSKYTVTWLRDVRREMKNRFCGEDQLTQLDELIRKFQVENYARFKKREDLI